MVFALLRTNNSYSKVATAAYDVMHPCIHNIKQIQFSEFFSRVSAEEADVSPKITCRIKELGPLTKQQRNTSLGHFCFSEYLIMYLIPSPPSEQRQRTTFGSSAGRMGNTSAVLFRNQQDKFVPEIPCVAKPVHLKSQYFMGTTTKVPRGLITQPCHKMGFASVFDMHSPLVLSRTVAKKRGQQLLCFAPLAMCFLSNNKAGRHQRSALRSVQQQSL